MVFFQARHGSADRNEENELREVLVFDQGEASGEQESSGSDSESEDDNRDLYAVYEQIMRELEIALEPDRGWVWTDADTIAQLQDVVMNLEHWKNSVRWSAKDQTSDLLEAPDESLFKNVLGSLKSNNRFLYYTIRARLDEISENLEGIQNQPNLESG
jgi:hypothetical protein